MKEEASIFLPHMMFSQLAEHHPENFAKFFCFQEATSFWKNVEHVQDPRLAPPLSLDKRVVNPAKTCPIFIHGDGVGVLHKGQPHDMVMGTNAEQ